MTLAPNVTEMVSALGSGGVLVATDDNSDFPVVVKTLPKVGSMALNIELVSSIRPDLVIWSPSARPANLQLLTRLRGIQLLEVKSERLRDIAPAMRALGAVLQSPAASSEPARVEAAIELQRRRRQKIPRVLFVVSADPLFVAGRQTFIDDLLELTGATNAVEQGITGWQQYSLETVVQNPPDIILYADELDSGPRFNSFFERDSRWSTLVAIRNSDVHGVDEDRFTRPGPRVADAARDLNRILDEWKGAGH